MSTDNNDHTCAACQRPVEPGAGHYNYDGNALCSFRCWTWWVGGEMRRLAERADRERRVK